VERILRRVEPETGDAVRDATAANIMSGSHPKIATVDTNLFDVRYT